MTLKGDFCSNKTTLPRLLYHNRTIVVALPRLLYHNRTIVVALPRLLYHNQTIVVALPRLLFVLCDKALLPVSFPKRIPNYRSEFHASQLYQSSKLW